MDREEALRQIGYMREVVDGLRLRLTDYYWTFLLWGAVWIVGYTASWRLSRDDAGLVWIGLLAVASVVDGVGRYRQGRGERRRPTLLGKALVRINLALIAAAVLVPLVVVSNRALFADRIGMYIAFGVGVMYVVNGFVIGREMLAIGAWILGAAVAGSFMPAAASYLWMAFAGGGGLVATAVVLRFTGRRHVAAAA
jgi:hypothetical protein